MKLKLNHIYCGNTLKVLKTFPNDCIDTIITSPPYWGLRDYGVRKQIGLEKTLEKYHSRLLKITKELKRVLKPTGILFWDHGDSYGGSGHGTSSKSKIEDCKESYMLPFGKNVSANMQSKCLIMQNYRLILKMIDEQGWILRNIIIWAKCLSGSTMMFAYVNNRPLVASLKDILRLKGIVEFPASDGSKVELLKYWKIKQQSIHITFRDGIEITCSIFHKFVLENGNLIQALALKKGDVIKKVKHNLLPLKKGIWNYEWGWFIGLYLAEGSLDKKGIRLSLDKKEIKWQGKIQRLFKIFGVKVDSYIYNNNLCLQVHSSIAIEIIDTFIRGKGSKGKRLTREAFMYGTEFIEGIINGWLEGDGHFDRYNQRWRVGITRNKGLIDDLRACALIVGYMFRARQGYAKYQNGTKPIVRITVRKTFKSHSYNRKSDTEIMRVTPSKERELYNIEVKGNHLFTLLNGALSHNSNPMPSSVKDRLTVTYEPVFMLVKNKKYYFDLDAIRVPHKESSIQRYQYQAIGKNVKYKDRQNVQGLNKFFQKQSSNYQGKFLGYGKDVEKYNSPRARTQRKLQGTSLERERDLRPIKAGKNPGDVWQLSTQPFPQAHFAIFPEKLIIPMIKAGCPRRICEKCGKARVRMIETIIKMPNFDYKKQRLNIGRGGEKFSRHYINSPEYKKALANKKVKFRGWTNCGCDANWKKGIILDPFMGAGTIGVVAKKLRRNYIGIDLNPKYVKMAKKRIKKTKRLK